MWEGRPAFPPKWQDPHTGAEPLRNEPLAGILVEVEWGRHTLSPGDRGRGRPAPTPVPSQWAASPLAIRLREALAVSRVYLATMSFGDRLEGHGLPGPVLLSTPSPMREATSRHELFMRAALEEARAAAAAGEVPVGAVVVLDGRVVGRGHNRPIAESDPTAHAEIEALRAAGRGAGNYRLADAALYVTVEPCLMCAGACLHARVGELVFGAADDKAGAVVSQARVLDGPAWNHRVRVTGGVLAAEARDLLQAFFRTRRAEGYRSGRTGLDSKSSWG